MKLILDTDVIVAAFRSPAGGSAELLRKVARRQCRMAVSVALMLEYEAVLMRQRHLDVASANQSDVGNFLKALASLAEPVQINYHWRPQTHDPNDEMVLEAAINGSADAIATFNKRDFGDAPERFGIKVLLPGEILEKSR